jgi:hypothetical protein
LFDTKNGKNARSDCDQAIYAQRHPDVVIRLLLVCWGCAAVGFALEWYGLYCRPQRRWFRWGATGLGCAIMAFGVFSLAFGGWPWTWTWLWAWVCAA